MDLYLVRHGQSYINVGENSYLKNPDEPLTPLGEQQVEAVGAWIAENIQASYLYSSTITRAKQTAEAISRYTQLPIIWDDRLREIGTNGPDGTALDNTQLPPYIEGRWGTLFPYDAVTEGGENWMQFRSRVGSFIESLRRRWETHVPTTPEERQAQTVLVVCHGGVIEAFFEYIFEKGPWSVVSVVTSNTGITHFRYQPRDNRPDWTLYYQNRLSHLTPDLFSS
jgi:broad specificity phosphatase PhoE